MSKNYFRPNIEAMEGYTPGEQPKVTGRIIKLNTNENPYPPSPKALEAAVKEIDQVLRLYPDPFSTELRTEAAKIYGVDADNIIAGNGSDELLMMLLRAFVNEDGRVAYPTPTYSLYKTLIEAHNAKPLELKWSSDWQLPAEIMDVDANLIFLCRPNAPSGTVISVQEVEKLAASFDGILCVDEAYADFAEDNCIPLVKKYDNVIVLRTFSKSYSLAGMRIGLAVCSKEIISGLNKIRDSYNLDRVAIKAGAAAIKDDEWMRENTQKIKATRTRLSEKLTELGFDVLPSQTNFVFARIAKPQAKEIYEKLKETGIFVRYFNKEGLSDGLRITVGTDSETDALLDAIDKIINGG